MATAYINDEEIIASGSAVILKDDRFSIRPFSDDQSYILDFEFNLEDPEVELDEKPKFRSGLRRPGTTNERAFVEVYRHFKNDENISPKRPLNFASDEEYEFYIRFSIKTFGTFKSHTINLIYVVSRIAL